MYRKLYPAFYASQLKPHIGPVPDTEPPVVLNDDDDEGEYEVEWKGVLDVQNVKQGQVAKWQFLVLQKGYLLAEATWEPKQH